jgi:hypothetical protein
MTLPVPVCRAEHPGRMKTRFIPATTARLEEAEDECDEQRKGTGDRGVVSRLTNPGDDRPARLAPRFRIQIEDDHILLSIPGTWSAAPVAKLVFLHIDIT